MDDVGSATIGEETRPVAVYLIEALDGIALIAQGRSPVGVLRNRDRGRMAEISELVREIVNVNGAVGAKIVIESEKDVTHANWRGL